MIQLIEAPPRSGKTFYFVKYLSKFWEFDELYNEYVLDSNVLIISNVEGLKVRHWKYPDCLKGRTIEEFFTIENFEAIMEKTGKNHIILGLDEVHEIFPDGYKSESVYNFFAYHGHIGIDVFLMTQGIAATSRLFLPLLEFVVKVKPRSQKLYKIFSYDFHTVKGQFLYSKKMKTDDRVFAAYKSFRKDEQNKPKSALLFWVVLTFFLFATAATIMTVAISSVSSRGNKTNPPGQKLNISKDKIMPGPHDLVEPVRPDRASPAPVARPTGVGFEWRGYSLDGWLESGDKLYVIIAGKRFVVDDQFRNFNPSLSYIEFFGPDISRARVAAPSVSYVRPKAPSATSAKEGEPLGDTSRKTSHNLKGYLASNPTSIY